MSRAVHPDDVAALRPDLVRYAKTLALGSGVAEDIVQDTIVKALVHLDSFRGESSLRTWLHRMLHRTWLDQRRRQYEKPSDDLDTDGMAEQVERLWRDGTWTIDAETAAEVAQTRDAVRDALIHLPYIYAAAVVLHDAEGLTAAEVAAVHEVTLPAAKQRLRRGRMMLATALAEGPRRRRARKGVPMDCWEVRRQVSDYLDEDLDTADARRLERHLRLCPTCPPLYAGIVSAVQAVGDLADPDSVVPPRIVERLSDTPADPSTGDCGQSVPARSS